MMKIKNTDSFALAVVQSSSADLTVEDKLALYVEAKEKAKNYNDKQPPASGMEVFKD